MSLQLPTGASGTVSIAELALQSAGFLHEDKYQYFVQIFAEAETYLRAGETIDVSFRAPDAGPALLNRLRELRTRGKRPDPNILPISTQFRSNWMQYAADWNWLRDRIDRRQLSWDDLKPDIAVEMLSPEMCHYDQNNLPPADWQRNAQILSRVRGELEGLDSAQRAMRRERSRNRDLAARVKFLEGAVAELQDLLRPKLKEKSS